MAGVKLGEGMKVRWAAHSCDRSLRSTLFPNSRRRTSSTSESSGLHVHTGWEGIWEKKINKVFKQLFSRLTNLVITFLQNKSVLSVESQRM